MKILIAGCQHETNTFSPIPATYADFERSDLWPPLLTRDKMIDGLAGINLPCTGFIEAARKHGDTLIPTLWCSAEPSGPVEDEAFETIMHDILAGVHQALASGGLDAIYLDLHGAMMTCSYDDAEAEILQRLRNIVGQSLPIAVSLDFHANVSPEMLELADVITIYRTYPHIDLFETGERAHQYLCRWMQGELRIKQHKAFPYLIPLSSQCTEEEPNHGLFQLLHHKDYQHLGLELALGFPPSDTRHAGPSILVYGETENAVQTGVDFLYSAALDIEPQYHFPLLSPQEAIAKAHTRPAGKPIVLADVQDNPGAGASCDTVGILAQLHRSQVKNAVVAALCDPRIVDRAFALGVGQSFTDKIGDYFHYDDAMFEACFHIEKLSKGRFPCLGEMYRGAIADVGPLALLRITDNDSNILVVVSKERFQCVDRSLFAHFEIDSSTLDIIVLKSTVHYRADFDLFSGGNLLVVSPGGHPCTLDILSYKKLRQGVRLGPCGPASTHTDQ